MNLTAGREGTAPKGCCHIVSAGPSAGFAPTIADHDMLIAADAGYLVCAEAGLVPDLVIGDFDSMAAGRLCDAACPRETLPVEKDDTDTVAALRRGLALGYTRFHLHCALGGDVGHELANVQALSFLRSHGARGTLHGCGQDVFAVFPEDGEVQVAARRGMRVSVFAYGGDARGVCEHGLRWELEDAILSSDFPLGVSNEALGEKLSFSVSEGALLVVMG